MALSFPTSPTAGQQYIAPNGITYTWNATLSTWTSTGVSGAGGGGGGAVTSVTGTAPIASSGGANPAISIVPGTARQLLQTNAGGTAAEFTSNVDVPGTLDVTGLATFDSQAVHPLGTAAAPSVTFLGDTDTGFYSAGAGRISVSNNGVNTVEFSSNGDVFFGGTTVLSAQISILPIPSAISFLGATAGTVWAIGPNGGDAFGIVNQSSIGVEVINGATAWSTASDERIKTDLIPIENGLNKVSSLRAFTGRYKKDEVGVSRSFLIAQDVLKVLPEAVSESNDKDKTLGLRYTEVIPLLVSALHEAKDRIEALEAEVTTLKTGA